MFTGIIRAKGTVTAKSQSKDGAIFSFQCPGLAPDLGIGDSVSVDGVCLTVTECGAERFSVEATPETLKRSNLGERAVGQAVNLEPSTRPEDFLGGHIVQGHVDATGRLLDIREEGNSKIFRFQCPPSVGKYCVMKGSVAVNGVSLTVSGLDETSFEVTIIPHTLEATNFAALDVGDRVNLEADIISKYVESHVERLLSGSGSSFQSDSN